MTEQQNPITPPPELRALWRHKAPRYRDGGVGREDWLIDSAAQWGAEQAEADIERKLQEAADRELEACCEWLDAHSYFSASIRIREDRRPKPPSLKERLSKAIVEGDEREALKLLEELDDSL